jgi:hypothetical protein
MLDLGNETSLTLTEMYICELMGISPWSSYWYWYIMGQHSRSQHSLSCVWSALVVPDGRWVGSALVEGPTDAAVQLRAISGLGLGMLVLWEVFVLVVGWLGTHHTGGLRVDLLCGCLRHT